MKRNRTDTGYRGALAALAVAALAWVVPAAAVPIDQLVLAHGYFPPPNGLSAAGDLHFNIKVNWVDQFDDAENDAADDYDFFTVALHELGHSLGLGHSTDVNSVMYPFYQGGRRDLTQDDIDCITTIYGGAGGACDFGTIQGGAWGKNPATGKAELSFSVMPFGSVVEDWPGLSFDFFSLLPGAGDELAMVHAAFAKWVAVTNLTDLGTVADDGSPFNAAPADPQGVAGKFGDIRLAATHIPEPATMLLLGAAALAFAAPRRRMPVAVSSQTR